MDRLAPRCFSLLLIASLLAGFAPALPASAANAFPPGATIGLLNQTGGMMWGMVYHNGYVVTGVGPRLAVLSVSAQPGHVSGSALTRLLPGVVNDVAVQGNFAYVADGRDGGLILVDLSDPAHPNPLSSVRTGGLCPRVAVSGNTAYVADSTQGLTVVDVSDPAHPAVIGSYSASGEVQGVTVSGGYAYTLNELEPNTGLHILNVEDPGNIQQAGFIHYGMGPRQVVLDGSGYAYLVVGNSLRIIDVSNPAVPAEVGHFDFPLGGFTLGVAVAYPYAYVADGLGGLRVVNVSDRAHPVETGSLAHPSGTGDTVFNHLVAVSGPYAYTGWTSNLGLQIVDISNPAAPSDQGLGGYRLDIGFASEVAASTSSAFFVDEGPELPGAGLTVFDAAYPATFTPLSTYRTGGVAQDVELFIGSVYIADGPGGLAVLNVGDPANPKNPNVWKPAGACNIAQVAIGFKTSLGIPIPYPYVLDNMNDKLYRLRMGSPISVMASVTFANAQLTGLAVDPRGYVLVTDRSTGLHIIAITDAGLGAEVGSLDTPDSALRVDVSSTYAYIADAHGGLRIVDIANPAFPSLAAVYPVFAEAVQVYDQFAFVATSGDGVIVLDVSDPLHPALAGQYQTGMDVTSLAVTKNDGRYLIYAAAEDGGAFQLYYPSYKSNLPLIMR